MPQPTITMPRLLDDLYTDALRLSGLAEAFIALTHEGPVTSVALAVAATIRELVDRLADGLDRHTIATAKDGGAQ